MTLPHTFLVWGPTPAADPRVITLTCEEADRYLSLIVTMQQGELPASCTFGYGIETAVPALPDPMLLLAEEYTGPHAERVRYLAACILLGRPFNAPQDGPSGGQPARLIPPTPTQPPGGIAVPAPSPAARRPVSRSSVAGPTAPPTVKAPAVGRF